MGNDLENRSVWIGLSRVNEKCFVGIVFCILALVVKLYVIKIDVFTYLFVYFEVSTTWREERREERGRRGFQRREREKRVEFLGESRTSTRPCSFHWGLMRQRALRSDIESLLRSSTRLSSFSKLKEAEGLGGRERRRRSHSTSEGA